MCEASERDLALEAAIRRINGVVSAKVNRSSTGEVVGVNVLVGSGAGTKRVVRDVESACMAHLGRRLDADALSVTRAPRSSPKTRISPGKDRNLRPDSGAARAQPVDTAPGAAEAGEAGGMASDDGAGGASETRAPADSEPSSVKPGGIRRYRVVSAGGRDLKREAGEARPDQIGEGDDEDSRSEPRIGVRQVGINVYRNRIHATVELACAGRTFTGECDGIPTEENRFSVPVNATLRALDHAFGGLVGVSVDDVQVCRLSGRRTAVVLATVGAPWGDVPSTGASYATRSEEEAVIRALLHAVNRCVTLTYGGEGL